MYRDVRFHIMKHEEHHDSGQLETRFYADKPLTVVTSGK